MAGDTKIYNANIKRNHITVKPDSYLPLGEGGTDDSIAISVYELTEYINGASSYIHEQLVPSTIWNIPHNLNSHPGVLVLNTLNYIMVGEIHYVDNNTVSILFSEPIDGKAYCKKIE